MKAITTMSNWAARLTGAGDALTAAREAAEAHARLTEERGHLLGDPPSLADLLLALDREVDALGGEWLNARIGDIAASLSGEIVRQADGTLLLVRRTRVTDGLAGGALGLAGMCALAGPAVKAAPRAGLERIRPASGPSLAERARRLTDVDAKIATLEAEHEALVDAAAKAGVHVPHLPSTAARRRHAEQAAERAALEARDEALAARRRGA